MPSFPPNSASEAPQLLGNKVAFNTLGCKLNQFESDALASRFIQAGYEIVPFDKSAHVYIINSCTVTNKADRKSRNILHRAENLIHNQKKLQNLQNISNSGGTTSGTSIVILTGCFVDSHREEIEKKDNVFLIDNEHKNSIFEFVDAYRRGEVIPPQSLPPDRFAYIPGKQVFRTRGMVKIQDGCDNFCSFCIIPFVRGTARSRSKQDILASAQKMLDEGYKELVLTGVNMTRYKDSNTGDGFSSLLDSMLCLHGDYRLRISSIEPDQLDEHFLDLLEHERMTPHLHLCLQSGSEKILLQMRRQYTYSNYRAFVEKIRKRIPLFNITSDIIVGFPGETDKDFEASLSAIREIAFGHVHVFPYSLRKGTRAERMVNHCTEEVKKERSEIMRRESEACKFKYRSQFIGQKQRLLVELQKNGQGKKVIVKGFGEHYIPIMYTLQFNNHKQKKPDRLQLENTFIDARISAIEDTDPYNLKAEAVGLHDFRC